MVLPCLGVSYGSCVELTSLWKNGDLDAVEIALRALDLFGVRLLHLHAHPEVSGKEAEKKKQNEAGADDNDQDGRVVIILNDGDLLVAHLNNLLALELFHLIDVGSLVNRLVLVDNVISVDLHDWNVWHEHAFLLFLWLSIGGYHNRIITWSCDDATRDDTLDLP